MSDDYRLEVAAGATRSGKTYLTAKRVELEGNLLVWDAVGEFREKFKCRRLSLADLRQVAARGMPGRFAVEAPVTANNFELFCRCAWVWLRVHAHHGRRVALVIEELADVTPPGKAPPGWGEIVRKSMRYGVRLYALTQRPAESDKTVMGNATVLRCHAMARAADRRAMAAELDVPQATIDGLQQSLYQYVERDRKTGQLLNGGKSRRATKGK